MKGLLLLVVSQSPFAMELGFSTPKTTQLDPFSRVMMLGIRQKMEPKIKEGNGLAITLKGVLDELEGEGNLSYDGLSEMFSNNTDLKKELEEYVHALKVVNNISVKLRCDAALTGKTKLKYLKGAQKKEGEGEREYGMRLYKENENFDNTDSEAKKELRELQLQQFATVSFLRAVCKKVYPIMADEYDPSINYRPVYQLDQLD